MVLSGCSGIRGSENYQAVAAHDSLWVREELYFGSDIPTSGVVSDSSWEDFVNREIVARFPDGFSTLPAVGRYKYRTGEIKAEQTRIIVVFYPPQSSESSRKIDEIIDHLYKRKFAQESVLRVRTRAKTTFE